jgi:hypothetical protein
MMERRSIEGRTAEEIARELTTAFDKLCVSVSQQAASTD